MSSGVGDTSKLIIKDKFLGWYVEQGGWACSEVKVEKKIAARRDRDHNQATILPRKRPRPRRAVLAAAFPDGWAEPHGNRSLAGK